MTSQSIVLDMLGTLKILSRVDKLKSVIVVETADESEQAIFSERDG